MDWEIISDCMEEVAEWADYEADMATDPYKEEA
jgi:hypothetical protein